MPFPGWIVLAAPRHLGVLLEPSPAPLADARAAPTDLPDWLRQVRDVGLVAGETTGPIAVIAAGKLPRRLRLPQLGLIAGPERATVAVTPAATGFVVRGVLWFASEQAADAFRERFDTTRTSLLGSPIGRALLRNLHAYNALSGALLRGSGATLGFATSISGADARAGMDLAAEWMRRFFAEAEP